MDEPGRGQLRGALGRQCSACASPVVHGIPVELFRGRAVRSCDRKWQLHWAVGEAWQRAVIGFESAANWSEEGFPAATASATLQPMLRATMRNALTPRHANASAPTRLKSTSNGRSQKSQKRELSRAGWMPAQLLRGTTPAAAHSACYSLQAPGSHLSSSDPSAPRRYMKTCFVLVYTMYADLQRSSKRMLEGWPCFR